MTWIIWAFGFWIILLAVLLVLMTGQNIRLRMQLYRSENDRKRAMQAIEDAARAVDAADKRVDRAISSLTLSGRFPEKRVEPLPPSNETWAEIIEDKDAK